MSKTPKPASASPAAAAVHLPEMLLTLTRMQGIVFDAVMRQNIAVLDFLKLRFERDRDIARRLAAAREPQEAIRLWSDFWTRAAQDYATEPTQLSEAMQQSVAGAVARARHDAEEMLHVARSTAV